tara:strand:- start:459 stop:1799 length:1341 start_codon:yes stop_codon:yes gene_type:complete
MLQKIKFSFSQIIILLLFISLILRFYNLNYSDYWGDEHNTFFVSDPSLSFSQTLERIFAIENTHLFYFLLKKVFDFFGYYSEYGRITTAIVGSLIPAIIFFIFYKKIPSNILILACLTISSNIYLIDHSQEVRVQTYTCVTFLLAIWGSIRFLETKHYLYAIFFIFFSILSSMQHIFGLLIFISFGIYSLFLSYKNFLKINIVNIIGITIFLILNFKFLQKLFEIDQIAFAEPNINFYYDFYFTYFFGSFIFGKIVLATYLLLLAFNLKQILIKKNHILFITIIIFSSYLFPLIYTYVRQPCMAPRSIIFVLPLIIYSLFYFYSISHFKLKKIIMLILVAMSFVITFYSIINLKTQNLTRIKNYLDLNKISNIDLYIISSNVRKINYYSNNKYFEKNNIRLKIRNNLEHIPKRNLIIVDSKGIISSEELIKYNIVYEDPWNLIIKH